MLGFKCPRCHEGDLYETPTFSYRKPFDMYSHCPHCRQSYLPEPGFYYGAMFISYIISGWFSIAFILFFHWVLGWGMTASFGLLLLVCAVLFTYLFRLARSIWLSLMVKYNPQKEVLNNQTDQPA